MDALPVDREPDRFALTRNGQDSATVAALGKRDGGNHLVSQMEAVALLAG
ncbi:hypothetical protein [Bradyrhizobium sp. JR3.5]